MIHNEIFNEMLFSFEIVCKVPIYRFAVEGLETKRHTANLTPPPGLVTSRFVPFLGFCFFPVLHHPCIILDQHPQSVNEVDDYLLTFGDSVMDLGRKTN